MKIGLVTIQRSGKCTLKDMAGGFGTTFDVGDSPGAFLLEYAKKFIANVPDLGLPYLAAVLRKAGHEVIIFHNTHPPGCDLYLVQSSIVECVNERAAGESILKGGGRVGFFGRFASEVPDYFSKAGNFAIRGEPENLPAGTDLAGLSGIVDAGLVKDLDALPFPDWDGFPLEKYRYRIIGTGGAALPVQASRGCPMHCNYCPYKVNNPFRVRNPAAVVEEIARLSIKYGVKSIVFRDPDFTFNIPRLHELLTLIIGKKLKGISYYIEGRTDGVDRETVELMARAGIASWEIGIETPSRETLLKHGRNAPDIGRQEQIIRWCRRLGIRVVGNYMIGFPEDTEESILSVVSLAKKLNTFAVQFTVCTPYPGTEFFDEVRDEILTDKWEEFTGWNNVYRHPVLSPARLAALRERAYLEYHYRLSYVLSVARDVLGGSFARRGNRTGRSS